MENRPPSSSLETGAPLPRPPNWSPGMYVAARKCSVWPCLSAERGPQQKPDGLHSLNLPGGHVIAEPKSTQNRRCKGGWEMWLAAVQSLWPLAGRRLQRTWVSSAGDTQVTSQGPPPRPPLASGTRALLACLSFLPDGDCFKGREGVLGTPPPAFVGHLLCSEH